MESEFKKEKDVTAAQQKEIDTLKVKLQLSQKEHEMKQLETRLKEIIGTIDTIHL